MLPGRAVSRHDVEDAWRQPDFARQLGKTERGEGCELGGLHHDRVPRSERGRDFPRHHQQREVPGDDLTHDANRLIAGELRRQQLCPPGVMVEVAGDERNIEIARLADRLAVVETLEHGEEPRVALDLTSNRVEVASAGMRGEGCPPRSGGACGRDGRVDVSVAALRHAREHRGGRGVDRLEVLALGRRHPLATDVVAELRVVVRFEPLERRRGALGRRPVVHRLEQLRDGRHLTPSGDGRPPSSAPSRSARAGARCR